MDELLPLLKRCARYERHEKEPSWLLACLVIDVQDHTKTEKRSCSLEMLRNPELPSWKSKLHSWDLAHVTAHFLATLYSLRLVDQIFRALPTGAIDMLPAGSLDFMEHVSLMLPPLTSFPTIAAIAGLFQDTRLVASLRARLNEMLELEDEYEDSDEGVEMEAKHEKADKAKRRPQAGRKSNNLFDLLLED